MAIALLNVLAYVAGCVYSQPATMVATEYIKTLGIS